MNKEEAKKLLTIISAFIEGKRIEYKPIGGMETEWVGTCLPSFNTTLYDYRIKPSPTYRPFANAEECWKEMLKHQPFGWVIDTRDNGRIAIESINVAACNIEKYSRNYDVALKVYTFADGQPFGVKVEE